MSEEAVALVRAFHPPSGTVLTDFFRSGEAEALLRGSGIFAPDVEIFGGSVSGLGVGPYHGIDALVEGWREWLEPWATYRTEVEDFVDAGGENVIVHVRDLGRMKDSDYEVELNGASVWTVRDGQVVRVGFYASREEAYVAAGYEPSG